MRPLSAATEAAPVTPDVTSEPGATGARRPVGEIVDWSVIDQLRAFSTDDMDLVRELVASFEVNVTQHLPELEQAVRRDDAETARFIAHRLRGGSANIGARRMEFLCERLETLGRAGVTIGAMELVDDLWAEFARVRAAFGSDDAGN